MPIVVRASLSIVWLMLTCKYVKASKKCLFFLDKSKTIEQIKQIQSRLTVSGTLKDPYASAKIISFCALSNPHRLSHAYKLFLHLPNPSTFIWNTLIKAFTQINQPNKAITLYKRMLQSGLLPNNYTFSFLFKAFADLSGVILCITSHAQALKLGFESHDFVINGLLHLYSICGFIDHARRLFDMSDTADVVAWTALISGYVKCGKVFVARELFDQMPERNSVSWSAMISGYVQVGLCKEALELFNSMLVSGFWPNHAAIICAINSCASLGALDQGRWIHAFVSRNNVKIDILLGSALIDMYAKCGFVEMACELFEDMSIRDVYTFTCLISGFANHGKGHAAVELFERMLSEGVVSNEVTFLCVLNACSQSGLVEKGLRIFRDMRERYGVEPGVQHYGCLVDLFGRAGMLFEAERVVNEMPMEPDSHVLGALLNACRVCDNIELGKETIQRLVGQHLDSDGAHVLLSNMYASAKNWDDVEKMRQEMENKKVRKVPGCSLIEVDSEVYEFVAGDRSHKLMDEIGILLQRINKHLNSHSFDDNGNYFYSDIKQMQLISSYKGVGL